MYLIIIVNQQTLTLNTFIFENELYNTSVDERNSIICHQKKVTV